MATIDRYVDPGVIGGLGDGTSWANAYNSLNTFEAGGHADAGVHERRPEHAPRFLHLSEFRRNPVRGSVLHFNDQRFHHSEPQHTTRLPQPFATGFDSSSPTVTLVSGFDLGRSAATVADADVQAALTEIVNPRMTDTATWTFSVQRGSSAPVSPSTYAAAGSVTVGGSGRYISVTAKCLSTGRIQAGSLDMSRFRIPYTP